jgi:hypothetical protein
MPPLTLLLPSQWIQGITSADARDMASADHFETLLHTLALPRSITPLVQPRYQDTGIHPLRTKSIAAALNHPVNGELPKTSLLVLGTPRVQLLEGRWTATGTTNMMMVTSCAAQHPEDNVKEFYDQLVAPRKGWPAAHNVDERWKLKHLAHHEGFLSNLSSPNDLHFIRDFVDVSHEIAASLGATVPTTRVLLTCPPDEPSHIKFVEAIGDLFNYDLLDWPLAPLTEPWLFLNVFAGVPDEITAQDPQPLMRFMRAFYLAILVLPDTGRALHLEILGDDTEIVVVPGHVVIIPARLFFYCANSPRYPPPATLTLAL